MKAEELANKLKQSDLITDEIRELIDQTLYSEYNKGMLTVIEFEYKKQGKHWMGLYECECGNKKAIQNISVRHGLTKSCGCISRSNNRDHSWFDSQGISNSPEYRALFAAFDRCESNSHPSYKRYGKRGIKVCDRWKGENGLLNFIEDLGKRPSNKYSLDRIDVNGDYCPENCRWADASVQCVNRRGYGETSKYIGISFNNKEQKWIATIYYKGKYLFNKRFNTEVDAVKARNDYIVKYNLPHRLN